MSRFAELDDRWQVELYRRLRLGQFAWAMRLVHHLVSLGQLDRPLVLGKPGRRELLRATW